MKNSIISIITAIVLALVITSTASAASDRAIDAKMMSEAVAVLGKFGISSDQINLKKSSVEVVGHTQKNNTHWVAANVSIQTREWGKYNVATYVVIVESGLSLKHSKSWGVPAHFERKENIDKFNYHLAEAKALAKNYGDETQFVVITMN